MHINIWKFYITGTCNFSWKYSIVDNMNFTWIRIWHKFYVNKLVAYTWQNKDIAFFFKNDLLYNETSINQTLNFWVKSQYRKSLLILPLLIEHLSIVSTNKLVPMRFGFTVSTCCKVRLIVDFLVVSTVKPVLCVTQDRGSLNTGLIEMHCEWKLKLSYKQLLNRSGHLRRFDCNYIKTKCTCFFFGGGDRSAQRKTTCNRYVIFSGHSSFLYQ